MVVMDEHGEHRIRFGVEGKWETGSAAWYGGKAWPIACSGAWIDANTFAVKTCHVEAPFCPTLTFRFDGDKVLFNYRSNVSFGPTEHPQVEGLAEEHV